MASLARGEATRCSFDALYLSRHIFRFPCTLPQQIACPPDGQAMPGTYGAVNRHGNKQKGLLFQAGSRHPVDVHRVFTIGAGCGGKLFDLDRGREIGDQPVALHEDDRFIARLIGKFQSIVMRRAVLRWHRADREFAVARGVKQIGEDSAVFGDDGGQASRITML